MSRQQTPKERDDLRKLTFQQLGSVLRSYGMAQKQIDTLKRYDRVHCIRYFATKKSASDGVGDGLFARSGEKTKLSEQKQIAALSASQGDAGGDKGEDADAADAQNKEDRVRKRKREEEELEGKAVSLGDVQLESDIVKKTVHN